MHEAQSEEHQGFERYEIRLKGQLDERWAEWFDGLTISPADNGDTLLASGSPPNFNASSGVFHR